MKYVMMIGADGLPSPEDLAVMQREIPGWIEEMNSRGVRLFGRELDLPETAATVRVRDGQLLVTDGPFTEAKEFIAGFDLLDCADLDEAIEVAARCPISWSQTLELRPFTGEPRLGEQAAAFGRGEDGVTSVYLMAPWTGGSAAARDSEGWRQDIAARGLHVLGGPLGGADSATTVRVRDGKTLVSDEPFTGTLAFVAGLDVVSCADRQQAIQLAAAHPLAREHAIEVRPFYRE